MNTVAEAILREMAVKLKNVQILTISISMQQRIIFFTVLIVKQLGRSLGSGMKNP
ncbi:MAG: hypothetical protein IJ683_01575 [Butyrivibrio sp.]|nr:hypothetical protein [Butyrivibrio sp.]MBR1640995.1 hypothetical protein [Butyrivibrio sp.]